MLIEIENLSVTFTAQGRHVRAVQDVSLSVSARGDQPVLHQR